MVWTEEQERKVAASREAARQRLEQTIARKQEEAALHQQQRSQAHPSTGHALLIGQNHQNGCRGTLFGNGNPPSGRLPLHTQPQRPPTVNGFAANPQGPLNDRQPVRSFSQPCSRNQAPVRFGLSTNRAQTHPSIARQPTPPVRPVAPLQKITAQAVLVSRSRFQVRGNFCQPLVEMFKRFRTKHYDMTSRIWSFDLSDYSVLERAVRSELKDFVILEELPKFVVDAYAKGLFSNHHTDTEIDLLDRIPTHLLNALLPYQVEGVRFAVRNNGRILLADDMGLGKTIQAISAAVYYRDDWPVLCVCPSSMRFEWKEQWLRWVRDLAEHDISVITGGRQTDSLINVKIVIITYDLLATMKKYLAGNFPTVIFDECHSLKNYKAVRTKAAVEVCQDARHLLLLSGTPALSKPSELYPQIELLNKSIFRSFPDFGRRYCNGHISRGFMDYSGQSNAEELQILLQSTVMIRRMKTDVAQQLPEKRRVVVILDPDMVRFHSPTLSLSASNYKKSMADRSATHTEIRKCLLNYYQHTGKAKLPAVVQYMQETLDGNDALKVVIFAHHTEVLNEIYNALSGTRSGIRIDGSTLAEMRKQLCDTFQRDDNCRFAVLSITACSSGITLTAASLVVFAELYWNPGILAQAEDRLHRLGQKNSVTVKYLVAKNTADDHMWTLLQHKLEFLNDVGLSKDNFKNAVTENQDTILPPDIWEQMLADVMEESARPASPSKRMKMSENDD